MPLLAETRPEESEDTYQTKVTKTETAEGTIITTETITVSQTVTSDRETDFTVHLPKDAKPGQAMTPQDRQTAATLVVTPVEKEDEFTETTQEFTIKPKAVQPDRKTATKSDEFVEEHIIELEQAKPVAVKARKSSVDELMTASEGTVHEEESVIVEQEVVDSKGTRKRSKQERRRESVEEIRRGSVTEIRRGSLDMTIQEVHDDEISISEEVTIQPTITEEDDVVVTEGDDMDTTRRVVNEEKDGRKRKVVIHTFASKPTENANIEEIETVTHKTEEEVVEHTIDIQLVDEESDETVTDFTVKKKKKKPIKERVEETKGPEPDEETPEETVVLKKKPKKEK